MRETVKDKGRLEHILAAIERIERFSAGKTFESLREDELTYYALVKCIEIIGEASYMLTNEFREAHPQTEWRDIIAMRHVLVHGYYQVSVKQVWMAIDCANPFSSTVMMPLRFLSASPTSSIVIPRAYSLTPYLPQ